MLGNASHHNKAVVITPFTKYFFSVKRVIKFILVSVEKRKGIITIYLYPLDLLSVRVLKKLHCKSVNPDIRITELCKRFLSREDIVS